MSTIKVIPRKEGDRIVCDEWLEPCPSQKDYDNFASYYGAKERWLEKRNSIKTYPTFPSDSAWFEERLEQVIDVNIEIRSEAFPNLVFAIPPKQDLCKCDQYLQMQAENERLKGLVCEAYGEGIKFGVGHPECFLTWQQFKTKHNL